MKINLIAGHAPDILLINALSEHYSPDDLFEQLNLGSGHDAEVKLTVNGFEVPFDLIVKNIYEVCETVHDDEVIRRAMKLLNLAGLDEFEAKMREARENIENALERAVSKLGI